MSARTSSPPGRGPAASRFIFGLACLAAALGAAGCFFGGGAESKDSGGSWDDFPNPNLCGDLTPSQLQAADAQVEAARPRFDGELRFFLSDSAEAWSQVKRRDLAGLQREYGAALQSAPNHCGALFGHAVATALSVVGDPSVDALARELERTGALPDAAGLAKVQAGEAAETLIEVRRSLAQADTSLLTLAQAAGGQALLRLDTAISGLEKVVANPGFRFQAGSLQGSGTWQLDRGEAAPILAGLKVLKAVLLLVVGYQWRWEDDDAFPHASVLRELRLADFDSLTQEQTEALDHYQSLVRAGSSFTRIRPGYAERVASIPDLLLAAVEHAQAGLAFGILQAERGLDQGRDPYKVGAGEDADADPADLKTAIDHLERVKPYLRGETALVFGKGADTLRVDFPRLFRIDGLQGLLPYFAFHPHALWNDSLLAAPSGAYRIRGPIYFTDAQGRPTLEGALLGDYLDDPAALSGLVVLPDPTLGGVFPGLTNETFWSKVGPLSRVESRVSRTCTEAGPTAACEWTLPAAPSDLDLLEFYLFRGL